MSNVRHFSRDDFLAVKVKEDLHQNMITQIILGSLALLCLIVATILNITNMNKQTDKNRKTELLWSTILMAVGFGLLAIAMIVSMISATSHMLETVSGNLSGVVQTGIQAVSQNPELLAALA